MRVCDGRADARKQAKLRGQTLIAKTGSRGREEGALEVVEVFEVSEAHPCDTPPPRPHLLIPPKLFHQLEAKNPNI